MWNAYYIRDYTENNLRQQNFNIHGMLIIFVTTLTTIKDNTISIIMECLLYLWQHWQQCSAYYIRVYTDNDIRQQNFNIHEFLLYSRLHWQQYKTTKLQYLWNAHHIRDYTDNNIRQQNCNILGVLAIFLTTLTTMYCTFNH